MALLPFGSYKPDVADYEGQDTKYINNVAPQGDGYGPFKSFAAATLALPAACRGACYALKSNGQVQQFAATSLGLYKLNNTLFTWEPVSRVASCTITNANPGVVSVTNTFVAGEPVIFGGTVLPSQLVAGTVYYVHATGLSGSSFSVSATAGGARIDTTLGGGSGTPTVTSHYSALSSDANWEFAQAGNLLFATQANDVLQVYNLASGTAFSNSLGSPPQAAHISVVGPFLVLTGLLSLPFDIIWSGLDSFNAADSWTAGVNSSDSQSFPDGGVVRGVAGGEFGTILQDQAIRRMSYIPGSDFIFQIERVTQDMGLFAPYSIIRAGSTIYFYSGKGFYKIDPGGFPVQIGRERVDRTFFNDLDRNNLQLFQGAADPRGTKIYWAYKSGAGAVGSYDKILGYDTILDRFFPLTASGEYLLGISAAGITLEGLDAISSSIDALTLTLDAYASSVQPQIAQFNSSHLQGFFTGDNLEATLQSSEQGTDGRMVYLSGFRPVTDAATVYGSLTYRNTQSATALPTTEQLINSRTGMVDVRKEARYLRMKTRIPAATTWTFIAGVEPVVNATGMT